MDDYALPDIEGPQTIYLSQEEHDNIQNSIKNGKLIRLIYICGIFYSTAAVIQSYNTNDLDIYRIFFSPSLYQKEQGQDLTFYPNSIIQVTFLGNSDEGHDEPYRAVVEVIKTLTKEIIEAELTGNVATHTHDSTYTVQEFDTDVWDGTSESSSLSGSGTKDDPYLIQSCADFVFMYKGGIVTGEPSGDSFEPNVYFKFVKNLDFNNKSIPLEDVSNLTYLYDADGNGITIKNIKPEVKNGCSHPIFGVLVYGNIHDFNIEGYDGEFDIEYYDKNNDDSYSLFSAYIYNNLYNIKISGTFRINGDWSKLTNEDNFMLALSSNYLDLINNGGDLSFQSNDDSLVIYDVDFVNNTTNADTDNGVLITSLYDTRTSIYCISSMLDDIDMNEEGEPSVSNFGGIYFQLILPKHGFEVYSPKSLTYVYSDGNDTFAGKATQKTLDEMKSEEFVQLVNSGLSEPLAVEDKDGGLPDIAHLVVDYDGYVKGSVYRKDKAEIEGKMDEFVPVFYISDDFTNNYNASINSDSFNDSWNKLISVNNGNADYLFRIEGDRDSVVTFVSTTNYSSSPDYKEVIVGYIRDKTFYRVTTILKDGESSATRTFTSTPIGGSSGGVTADQVLTKTNTTAYTPTSNYHPATKKYVDDNSVSESEVLTRTNITSYTPTQNYHPATKKYVDDQIASVESGGSGGGVTADQVLTKTNTTAYTPTQNYHPATKKYVDDNTVSSSEVLTRTNTSSYTPTNNYNPATKKYVDDKVESEISGLSVSSNAVDVTSYLSSFLPDCCGETSYSSSTRLSSSNLTNLRSVVSSGKLAYVKLKACGDMTYGMTAPVSLAVTSNGVFAFISCNIPTSNYVGFVISAYTNQSGSVSGIIGQF